MTNYKLFSLCAQCFDPKPPLRPNHKKKIIFEMSHCNSNEKSSYSLTLSYFLNRKRISLRMNLKWTLFIANKKKILERKMRKII